MADVAFVLVIIAFFALAALFVTVCDRVIGPDEEAMTESPENTASERLAA